MYFEEFSRRFETSLAEFQQGDIDRQNALRCLAKNGVRHFGKEPKPIVAVLLVSSRRFGGVTDRLLEAAHRAAFPMARAMENALNGQ